MIVTGTRVENRSALDTGGMAVDVVGGDVLGTRAAVTEVNQALSIALPSSTCRAPGRRRHRRGPPGDLRGLTSTTPWCL